MQVEILASPSFSFATVTITPSTAVHVEPGAMAAYSDGVEVETKARVDQSITYEVHKAGTWKTTVLGGEGLVTRFVGPGRLWLQTRNPSDFLGWLIPKLPTQRS
jgi:uncharacterized protein (AIM24 family)